VALIVYSSRTGRIRQIVIDDTRSDRALTHFITKQPGESSRGMALESSVVAQQVALTAVTGLRPSNDRYVAYDNAGVVDRVFIGDPDAGDTIRGRTVIADTRARIGWRRNRGDTGWERSVLEIDNAIQTENDVKTRVNSQEWQDREATREQTQAQIDAKRTARIADADAEIATLNTEKTDRNGARP